MSDPGNSDPGNSDPGNTADEREQAASPLERLLDVSVFAPLGFLLERNTVLDQLAQAGRRQIAFSRSLGRAALRTVVRGAAQRSAAPRVGHPPVAIDGYDDLTARQIIEVIGGCSDAEAEWIRTTESSGKGRVTVLRALERRGGRRG